MKEATMDPAPSEWRSAVEHKIASLFRRTMALEERDGGHDHGPVERTIEERLAALEAAFGTPGFIVKYVPKEDEAQRHTASYRRLWDKRPERGEEAIGRNGYTPEEDREEWEGAEK